ncbi:MAG: cell division protein FtsZ [Bacteroidota bacterium]
MPDMIKFDLPKNPSNIIKVIGVGGGGSNAVRHMFNQGIKGVDFIICNTDAQAMESSPVPTKIQLGTNLTSGLGAGAVPSIGRNAALEDADHIRQILSNGTKMLFVTAGLGGGTGTGAAPVIAEISKELGILTVGIVTLPFAFEGRKRKLHADEGIKQLKEHVDALLIISNDKLRELYGNLRLSEAFGQADNILTTGARGIAEIITVAGYINVDFEDVKTVMKNSGVAIMGTGISTGANRAQQAVEEAISSPLLNNNDIEGANNLLLYISSGKEEITMDEVTEITDYIQEKTKSSTEVIWGNGFDESLGEKISVTIIATGFDDEHRRQGGTNKKDVVIRDLYEAERPTPKVESRIEMPEPVAEEEIEVHETTMEVSETTLEVSETISEAYEKAESEEPDLFQREIVFDLDIPQQEPVKELQPEKEESMHLIDKRVETVTSESSSRPEAPQVSPSQGSGDNHSGLNRMGNDRIQKLKALSEKLKNHTPIENNLSELESVPAYKRRSVELPDVAPSSESQIQGMSLSEDAEKGLEIHTENSFLHKNVD